MPPPPTATLSNIRDTDQAQSLPSVAVAPRCVPADSAKRFSRRLSFFSVVDQNVCYDTVGVALFFFATIQYNICE